MNKKKVLVFYKKSLYEILNKKNPNHKFFSLTKKRAQIVEPILKAHDENLKLRKELFEFLDEFTDINLFIKKTFPKTKIKNFDIIITLGGDGTVLDIARYVKGIPLIAINSSPSSSFGRFCWASVLEFKKVFKSILSNEKEFCSLSRLCIMVNDIPLPYPALNDMLFADAIPARTSQYILKIKDVKEEQRSSGIWISTAAGSTGAILSAGGGKMPLSSKSVEFFVREPFTGMKKKYNLLKGIINSTDITIISKMLNGYVFVDGPRYKKNVEFGDKITFKEHSNSLNIFLPES